MAYLAPYLTDDEKKKAQAADPGAPVARPTSGVIGATSTSGDGGKSAPTPGTGFVNLQQYLDTNESKGTQLADTATADVQKRAADYRTTAANTAQDATKQFQKSAGQDTAAALSSGLKTDASANKQGALDFLGSTYTGPTAGDFSAPLAAQKTSLVSDLGAAKSTGAVQAGLGQAYGKDGNYNEGFGLLDGFLTTGTKSGQARLGQVAGKAAGIDTAYNNAQTALTAGENKAKASLEGNKRAVNAAAQYAKNSLVSDATPQVAAKNADFDASREGASAASLGDVLSEDKRVDLEALDEILKQSGNYGATWNEGAAKPGVAAPAAPGPRDDGKVGITTDDDGYAPGDVADPNDPTLVHPVTPTKATQPGGVPDGLVPDDSPATSTSDPGDPLNWVFNGTAGKDALAGAGTTLQNAGNSLQTGMNTLEDATRDAGHSMGTGAGQVTDVLLPKSLPGPLGAPLSGPLGTSGLPQGVTATGQALGALGGALPKTQDIPTLKTPAAPPSVSMKAVMSGGKAVQVPSNIDDSVLQAAQRANVDLSTLGTLTPATISAATVAQTAASQVKVQQAAAVAAQKRAASAAEAASAFAASGAATAAKKAQAVAAKTEAARAAAEAQAAVQKAVADAQAAAAHAAQTVEDALKQASTGLANGLQNGANYVASRVPKLRF